MSDLRISELPLAQTIQGNEKVVLVQNNETRSRYEELSSKNERIMINKLVIIREYLLNLN